MVERRDEGHDEGEPAGVEGDFLPARIAPRSDCIEDERDCQRGDDRRLPRPLRDHSHGLRNRSGIIRATMKMAKEIERPIPAMAMNCARGDAPMPLHAVNAPNAQSASPPRKKIQKSQW